MQMDLKQNRLLQARPDDSSGAQQSKLDQLVSETIDLYHKDELFKCRELAILALDLARKQGAKAYECDLLNLIGLYHAALTNYTTALEYYREALSTVEDGDEAWRRSTVFNHIAQVYFSMGELDTAREHYSRALQEFPSNYRALNNLAILHGEEARYHEAAKLYHDALELSIEAGNRKSQIICLGNLGETKRREGLFEESLNYFEQALELISEDESLRDWPAQALQYGEALLSAGRKEEAKEKLDLALVRIRELDLRQFEGDCLEALQKYYIASDDHKTAYGLAQEEIKLRKDVFTADLRQNIARITAAYTEEQEELRYQQLLEKSAKLASIGVMAAGITHEINQPLNAISVSANSILYWNKQNPKVLPQMFVEELEQIARGSDRIDEIIRHMRSFWISTESGTTERVNLNEGIRNALTLLERQLHAHGILLRLDIDAIDLAMEINPIDLEQIVINLVINAMNALDESEQLEKLIWIESRITDDIIELEIRDNGIGLPDIAEEKLFDPFYSTRDPSEGMGLGLAIVQQAASRMGGRVSAQNNTREGSGAVFTVHLPLTEEDADADPAD